MISVQNHRLRSNGSKTRIAGVCLFLWLVFSLQSCGFIEDLFQGKSEKQRTEKPEEKEKVEIREMEWDDETDVEDVIRNYPDKTEEKEEIYDVLCLLPFSGIHQDKGRSIYSGIKMAAQSSDPEVHFRITTFDIGRLEQTPETFRKVLSAPEFDMIIAPYSTQDVNQVIELSQGTGSIVMSPWNTSPDVNKFPRYVQMNPGLDSHFKGILDWTAREFGIENTLVIGHKKDSRLVEMLQEQSPDLENYYTASNPKEDITYLRELIASKDVKAVIVPSWRSSDEAYFLSLLSAINAARESQPISAFVLSSWMNNDNINYDQFNGMNLHFTSSRFINSESRAVQRFEERYMSTYHYFAGDDVYYGHDIYQMIVDWLTDYDHKITDELVNYECRDCFYRYDFVEEVTEEGQPYFTNDHVDIISFKDFQYHRVN